MIQTKNAYSYKLNSAWNGFPAYSTTIDGNLVSASTFFSVNSAGYIEWNDAKKDAGADFAKLAKAFVLKKILHGIRQKPQLTLK